MTNQNDDISETPFGPLAEFLRKYNHENPQDQQPITQEILFSLNELRRIEQYTAMKDGGVLDFRKYNDDYAQLTDFIQVSYCKDIAINFGHTVLHVESPLLCEQIRSLLKKHLKNNWPSNEKKRGRGQPVSRWQRVVIEGKPLIEKLYAARITPDFLANFFGVTIETFKRKIRK